MNDSWAPALEAVVAEALRGLRASPRRLEQIREELRAHLDEVVEEELARTADPAAALDRAKRRFGNATELAIEIRQSVPWLERWTRVYSSKEQPMVRMFGVGVAGILVGLGFVFPAVAHWRDHGALAAGQAALLLLGVLLTAGGVASVGFGVKSLRATH